MSSKSKSNVIFWVSCSAMMFFAGLNYSSLFPMESSNGFLPKAMYPTLPCAATSDADLKKNNIGKSAEDHHHHYRACTQNPYFNALSENIDTVVQRMDAWLEPEHYNNHILRQANHNQTWKWKWNVFTPFEEMASCQDSAVDCTGGKCSEEGSKITCGIQKYLQPGCVVYSLGGNNEWEFELDILAKTPCSVHTFDCTGPRDRFQVPQHDRLFFHYVCLGTEHEDAAAPDTQCTVQRKHQKCGPSWTLMEMQQNLGHFRIDLFKIDVEGWEWPLFQAWPELSNNKGTTTMTSSLEQQTEGGPALALPMQILVEIHMWDYLGKKNPVHVAELQKHFLKMGYVVMKREDNQLCPSCTELTLIRALCGEDA